MDLKITIHGVGVRRCSLHKKKKAKTDGVLVTFEDGSFVKRKFLSFAAFNEMIGLNAPPLPDESLGDRVAVTTNGEAADE